MLLSWISVSSRHHFNSFFNVYSFTFFWKIKLKLTLPIAIVVFFDFRNIYCTIIGVLVTFCLVIMNFRKTWAIMIPGSRFREFTSELKYLETVIWTLTSFIILQICVSYIINQLKYTSRTPFLGGFQIHFFQGTFVRQNSFAFSSIATTSCLPPLSVFLKTRYSSGSLLLHPKTKCQSNTNTMRNISMHCEKTKCLFVCIMVDAFISRCYKVTKLFYYHKL